MEVEAVERNAIYVISKQCCLLLVSYCNFWLVKPILATVVMQFEACFSKAVILGFVSDKLWKSTTTKKLFNYVCAPWWWWVWLPGLVVEGLSSKAAAFKQKGRLWLISWVSDNGLSVWKEKREQKPEPGSLSLWKIFSLHSGVFLRDSWHWTHHGIQDYNLKLNHFWAASTFL